jgi:arginyl-tRNA synthetase
MNEIIKQHLLSILNQLSWAKDIDVKISRTKSSEHGDFSSNIAMMLPKLVGQPPMKIARKIQSMVDHPDITRVEVASPGFLNFFTTRDYIPLIQNVLDNACEFFSPNVGKDQSIYLEYVSANPTGPLHVGHGRSAAYGSSLANILKRTQYKLHTEYYINDAGLQIHILTASLWLCILGKTVPEGCYRGDYLQESVKNSPKLSSVQPESLDQLLTQWDKDRDIEILIDLCKTTLGEQYTVLKTWIVDNIVSDIKLDLETFGVHFDSWYAESSLVESNSINDLITYLDKNGHTYEKDGALWFSSSKYGDEKDRVLKRSNGMWTYFANDLAYHHHKCQQGSKQLINIFGADHHGYVPRIKAGLNALGMEKQFQCILIQFANLYRAKVKVPMSTRSGQFVTLKELYTEVSVDAARFFYCMRKSDHHLDFDLELAKSHNNQNPVYYIQYAHARIQSIFNKHGQYIPTANHWQQANDLELEILELISTYPDVLKKISQGMEIYRLTQYLLSLATLFHKYYNLHPVLSDKQDDRYHRLLLCALIKTVISDGLSLLGIQALESM